MDSIKITITRNCNPDGSGGTVADSVAAVMQDGVLDSILDAFVDKYGEPPQGVSRERWYAVCVRKMVRTRREEYLSQQKIDSAKTEAADEVRTEDEQTVVVEG